MNESSTSEPQENATSARIPRGRALALLLGARTIRWLIIAAVGSLLLAVVELVLSIFLQLFLKSLGVLNVDVHTPLAALARTPTSLGVFLAVVALVRSLAQFFVGQSSTISMETINARIRRLAVWEMLLHPSKRIVPAASVNARVGDLAVKSSLFCYAGAALLGYMFQAMGLTVVMLLTSPVETVVSLTGLGFVGALVLRTNKMTRAVTANVPAELRVLTEGVERVSRNVALVRILRTQTLEQRRLSTSIDAYANRLVHAAYLANFVTSLTPFAGILLILLVVYISQGRMHTPGLTLLSFLYLFVRFVGALANAGGQYANCSTTWPSFDDSLKYVTGFERDEVVAAMRVGESLIGRVMERAKSAGGSPPSIEVQSVSFTYPGAKKQVLTDVSIEIPAGSQLAIIGPSGCGKSTLLALLLGLTDPSHGSIAVGGQTPSRYFDKPTTRVGYVGAEAFLIAGSVRENLRYGLTVEAGDADLLAALALARLRTVVEHLPGGLDYLIGEDGSGLSAGQKQRLCLARALLNRPHVLVLDEASANLDLETEDEIAESVRDLRGSCTTIVVSHRPRMIRFADATVTLGSKP